MLKKIDLRDLPPGCRPNYDRSMEASGVVLFRTRKDVMYHVMFVLELAGFNFFKEGPYYAVNYDGKIYATGWRNLYAFTVQQLEDCLENKYFPL